MKDLDKKIEDILFDKGVIIFADVPGDKKLKDITSTVVAQIKTVILEALKAEMPKEKSIEIPSQYGLKMTDKVEGYNQALSDCLEVINKLLGDSNAE